MEGLNYRACVELTDKVGAVVAAVGETCERVNPTSLPWLAEQCLIEPVSTITESVWQDLGRPVEGDA